MSSYIPTVETEYFTAVAQVWTDITAHHKTRQMNVLGWQQAIDRGEITAPFAVTAGWDMKPTDWAMDHASYLLELRTYYVGASASITTALTTIAGKLEALRDRLIKNDFDSFHVVQHPVLVPGDHNPVGAELRKSVTGLVAGALNVQLHVGETVRSQGTPTR